MPKYDYIPSDFKLEQCHQNPLKSGVNFIKATSLPTVMTLEVNHTDKSDSPPLSDKEEIENCLKQLSQKHPVFSPIKTPLYFSIQKNIIFPLGEEKRTIRFLNDIIITRNEVDEFSLYFFNKKTKAVSLLIGHKSSPSQSYERVFVSMLPIVDEFEDCRAGGLGSLAARVGNAEQAEELRKYAHTHTDQQFYHVTREIRNRLLNHLRKQTHETQAQLESICHYYMNSGYDQLLSAYHFIETAPDIEQLKHQLEVLLAQQHENFMLFAQGKNPTKSALPSDKQLEILIKLADKEDLIRPADGGDNVKSLLESLRPLKPLDEKESKKVSSSGLTNAPSAYFAHSGGSIATTPSSSISLTPPTPEKKLDIKLQGGQGKFSLKDHQAILDTLSNTSADKRIQTMIAALKAYDKNPTDQDAIIRLRAVLAEDNGAYIQDFMSSSFKQNPSGAEKFRALIKDICINVLGYSERHVKPEEAGHLYMKAIERNTDVGSSGLQYMTNTGKPGKFSHAVKALQTSEEKIAGCILFKGNNGFVRFAEPRQNDNLGQQMSDINTEHYVKYRNLLHALDKAISNHKDASSSNSSLLSSLFTTAPKPESKSEFPKELRTLFEQLRHSNLATEENYHLIRTNLGVLKKGSSSDRGKAKTLHVFLSTLEELRTLAISKAKADVDIELVTYSSSSSSLTSSTSS